MNETEQKQVAMHKDFFDRCRIAIDNGYYLEAILMEYAEMESRLEAICGIVGFPCGKNFSNRKDVKISDRVECLRIYRNRNKAIFDQHLSSLFFSKKGELNTWIKQRDIRIHGLFKNELRYEQRNSENRELAEKGIIIVRQLFNEAKRLRRMKKGHPEVFDSVKNGCPAKECCAVKSMNA